jgi:hypothetical protein
MTEKTPKAKKLTVASTKKELLEAYEETARQLQEKREAELRPEQIREEKKAKEVVQIAESLTTDGIARGIGDLRMEIGKMLTKVSDSLEEQVGKFQGLRSAIQAKEKELQELYGIEKAAATFAALVEAHNEKREQFESEMAKRKEELEREIEETRAGWERERKAQEASFKERDAEEKRKREREKEEFTYGFAREKQLAKDEFEDGKGKAEKELDLRKEQAEKELAEREREVAAREGALKERENELEELGKKVADFPREIETAVNNAVKETAERINLAAKNREELLKKEFDGERNVLSTRIEALERTVKEQREQISKLSQQLEKAYQKVEDIAVKTIEGSSTMKSLSSLQQFLSDQAKKHGQE